MKRVGQVVAWCLSRIVKIFGNILSFVVRLIYPVQSGRVACWAYNFKQYGCNPRYLTEYMLEHYPEFEICWIFRRGVDCTQIDPRIKIVRFKSWQYFKLMATAEFFVTNSRTDPYHIYWKKRNKQQYLMLWHGGVALKRIEQDAEAKLGYSYLRKAKIDSKNCDLMISGCRMHTELIKNKFWYDGAILEQGLPRNDIFFQTEKHAKFREHICKLYGIATTSHIVLYAPTFRRNQSIEPYRINWDRVRPALAKMVGSENVTVIVRMHPNLINKVDTSSLIAFEGVVDGTRYHDMQELLCISDVLITDYSSSMFDFSMQRRPCLLYATDIEEYDRGYYFDLTKLPYPLARNEEELLSVISNFDTESYASHLTEFFDKEVGLIESGIAAQSLADWLVQHSSRRHSECEAL